jgi:hypothetical protein
MATQSEQLEQQARHHRARLSETIEALRDRMTPGQVVDQVADYAQHGPATEFFRNLGREIRENPLPLTVIAIGVAWLIMASNLSSRARIRFSEEAGRETQSRDETVSATLCLERSGEIGAAAAQPGAIERRREARLRSAPALEQAHEG